MKTLIPARATKSIDQDTLSVERYPGGYIPLTDLQTWTGMGISPELALNSMTVYQCASKLADAFAQLPLLLYRRQGEDRERASDSPLYRVFHDAPNPSMSSFVWRRLLMGHVATWGNAYNEIVRNRVTGDLELWPIRPDRMEVRWGSRGVRAYTYVSPTGQRTEMKPGTVFHIQNLSTDGLQGLSPISAMRRGIGLYRKAEAYGEAVFDNGARPAVVMKHPKTLSTGAIERLGTQMDSLRGAGNAGKTVILEEGLDVHEIGFPPEDAQFMETRLFQKREIVTGFGLPLSMSGDPDFAAVKVEEKMSELFQLTMTPHFQNFQQEASLQLLDDPDLYVEFLTDALMWADPKARADALAVEWEHGNINNDAWRAKTNQPPLPDGIGQRYYVPANWIPVEAEPTPQPVGGLTSRDTQFGADASLPDQLTRAKSAMVLDSPKMRQFDCPDCGKLLARMAAPGTVAYCRSAECHAEKVMGVETEGQAA